jgi:cytoskeletal protein CcmA (bactofilin family)
VSEKDNGAVETMIGSDTRISGDIRFAGNALIDGYLEGNVKAEKSDSKLTISERGHVKGSIVVPHLLVNGTIEGKVCVAKRLEFGPKARIIGDVRYNLLEVSIGAQVDGKLIHKSEAGTVQKDKKAVAELSFGIAAPSDFV